MSAAIWPLGPMHPASSNAAAASEASHTAVRTITLLPVLAADPTRPAPWLQPVYVGRLKGVGPVWQLTAVDTSTRWAIAELYIGKLTSTQTVDLLDLVVERLQAIDVELGGIVTDNRPQFISRQFPGLVTELGIEHTRTLARSPDYNAVCERLQGTVLQEFYRPTFHRGHVSDVGLLNRQLHAWLARYNTRRPNRGAYMRGRTPLQVLQSQQRVELSPQPVASTV